MSKHRICSPIFCSNCNRESWWSFYYQGHWVVGCLLICSLIQFIINNNVGLRHQQNIARKGRWSIFIPNEPNINHLEQILLFVETNIHRSGHIHHCLPRNNKRTLFRIQNILKRKFIGLFLRFWQLILWRTAWSDLGFHRYH